MTDQHRRRPKRNRLVLTLAAAGPALAAASAIDRDDTGNQSSTGWYVTVYYTAVESHYDDEPVPVTGCLVIDCEHGDDDLGSYPESFVQAVENEGTGRIVSGRHAGSYLNWSHDTGFWLDNAPRDSHGRPLEPFVSAAADPTVLSAGNELRITGCGVAEDGTAIDPAVCDRLRSASWRIMDEFTPGLGGDRHIDVYLGEETEPDFTSNPLYSSLHNATLELLPARPPRTEGQRRQAAGLPVTQTALLRTVPNSPDLSPACNAILRPGWT
jgi:hypothetical protein